MKRLLLLLFTVLTMPLNSYSFESRDTIVNEFLKQERDDFKIKNDGPENFTDLQKEIISNLVPVETMFPLEVRQELDKKKIAKYELDDEIEDGVDLREFDTPVKNQWNGTCTSFGLIASIENALGGKVHLSERYFWSIYHKYSADIAISTIEKISICEEKYWPQSYSSFNTNECRKNAVWGLEGPTKYLSDDTDKIIDFIRMNKKPVYIKMTTPTEMAACKKFISDKSGATGGGHALAIVGYQRDKKLKSGGYFIIKNSWSDRCGDKGYQYLDFGFCKAMGRYCGTWGIDNVVKKKAVYVPRCLVYNRPFWKFWIEKKCIKWE